MCAVTSLPDQAPFVMVHVIGHAQLRPTFVRPVDNGFQQGFQQPLDVD